MKLSASLAIVLMLFISAPQVQAMEHSETDTATYADDISLPRGVLSGGLKFDATIKLSSLMNEPVVNCGARWVPDPLSKISITGNFAQGKQYVALDDEQRQKLRFYNLDLALSFLIPGGQTAYILCDAGVVGHGDQEPFNVAGSPGWDRLICVSRFWDLSDCVPDRADAWVAEDRARELYRELLESGDDHYLHSVKIVGAQVNAGAVLSHIVALQRAKGLLATLKRHAQEVNAVINEVAGQDMNLLASVLADPPPVDVSDQEYPEIYKQTLLYGSFAFTFTNGENLANVSGSNDAKAILALVGPLEQRLAAEREAAKQAYDDWGKESQRIVDESEAAFNAYRDSLEASKPAKALWYDVEVISKDEECYFIHPVTRQRAFSGEKFKRCELASIEHGWRVAQPYDEYSVKFIGGELMKSDASIRTVLRYPNGYFGIETSNNWCEIHNPDGSIASISETDNWTRIRVCSKFSTGKIPLMSATFTKRGMGAICRYFDEDFNMVHEYVSEYPSLYCGYFDDEYEGLAKIWDRRNTHCIDVNGRTVTNIKECTSW